MTLKEYNEKVKKEYLDYDIGYMLEKRLLRFSHASKRKLGWWSYRTSKTSSV